MSEPMSPRITAIPAYSEERVAIRVTPAAERAIRQGHPWLYADAITRQNHEASPGDIAVVFDRKGRFLAVGLYDPHSPIRVKLLQHKVSATIDDAFFRQRIQAAADLRAPLVTTNTDGYRLIHGENDGLPGLIVDRYDDVLVTKLYSLAWLPHLREIVPVLLNVLPVQTLVLRLSRNLQQQPELCYGLEDGSALVGEPPEGPVLFTENGLHFKADVVYGHKTGFFFDQRDNRQRVREYAAGRHVLDVFAYSGGFSVYAAAGGAASVLSLDVSAPALEAARANFNLNPEVARVPHQTLVADAFEGMSSLANQGNLYDLIIVDPPAFAKRQDEIDTALSAYAALTRRALALLSSEGMLVMASCSSRVNADAFYDVVEEAARAAGRPLNIVQRTSHARDHPIRFPEGAYLKALYATAD